MAYTKYAEGTFVPTCIGGTVAGATTYSSQNGYYIRIGNMVTVNGFVAFSAATGTGTITLGGLPFTIKNQANYNPIGTFAAIGQSLTTGYTQYYAFGTLNTNTIIIGQYNPVTGSAVGLNLQNAPTNLNYTMTYFV